MSYKPLLSPLLRRALLTLTLGLIPASSPTRGRAECGTRHPHTAEGGYP